MNEQTILTDYFTAAKSRQGLQPAKRRKIVTGGGGGLVQARSIDESSGFASDHNPSCQTTPSIVSVKTKSKEGTRSRKTRNLKETKRRRNIVPAKNPSEVAVCEVTSRSDDHQFDRPRKQRPSISEQASVVLASRGKRALEKSLEGKQSKGSSSKKIIAKPQPTEKNVSTPERSLGRFSTQKASVPKLHQGITASSQTPSAVEESGSKLPAYKRFSHLLEAKKPKASSPVTRNLPLPYHFKILEEMFRCVDVVLSLKQKRYETCTFDKLKESVQEMCRKKFEKKHLAQMKTVYPTAFVFRQQNGFCGQKKSEFQLTIGFNMEGLDAQKKKECMFVESSVLITRQKYFRKQLLKMTMKHHHDYLVKNHPSLSVDDEALMRWHPCFHVDEVPEICTSPLPEPDQVKTYSTAQDVLDRARQNMSSRVEKSLKLVAQKSKESNAEGKKVISNMKDLQVKTQKPALKGVSQSLIEKIRQKEEKKIQESLTVDPKVVEKRIMVQKLPELCRILKTYFVSERKAVISLEDASNKLSESCTSTLSSVQVEKHLKLLSELAPDLLSIMYVRKCPYVKLKKNININNLIEKLKTKEIN